MYEAAYRDEQHRFEVLKRSVKTHSQDDGSYVKVIHSGNAKKELSVHRRSDVPANTHHSLLAIYDYLSAGRKVFKYKVCWVPRILYRNNHTWIYEGAVARLKDVTHRTVSDNCLLKNIHYVEVSPTQGYKSRKFIKDDEKLLYWITDLTDPLLLDYRLDLVERSLQHKDILEEVRLIEEANDLEITGVYSTVSLENYFEENLGSLPETKQDWIREINEFRQRAQISKDATKGTRFRSGRVTSIVRDF